MGFKDAWNRQMARSKAAAAEQRAGLSPRYGALNFVSGGRYSGPGVVNEPIAGAVAEYESGAKTGRTTISRLAAGAVIAGPIGFVVGGLIKKDSTRGYVTIVFSNGKAAVFDDAIGEEMKMRKFVAQFNAAAAHFTEAG